MGSARTMELENSKCDWEPHCFKSGGGEGASGG